MRTFLDVPYPDFPVAASRDEQIRGVVVVHAEHEAGVPLEDLLRQALAAYIYHVRVHSQQTVETDVQCQLPIFEWYDRQKQMRG